MICGVDEAGRGPLAGPVFAAAVILGEAELTRGVAAVKDLAAGTQTEVVLEDLVRHLS